MYYMYIFVSNEQFGFLVLKNNNLFCDYFNDIYVVLKIRNFQKGVKLGEWEIK